MLRKWIKHNAGEYYYGFITPCPECGGVSGSIKINLPVSARQLEPLRDAVFARLGCGCLVQFAAFKMFLQTFFTEFSRLCGLPYDEAAERAIDILEAGL